MIQRLDILSLIPATSSTNKFHFITQNTNPPIFRFQSHPTTTGRILRWCLRLSWKYPSATIHQKANYMPIQDRIQRLLGRYTHKTISNNKEFIQIRFHLKPAPLTHATNKLPWPSLFLVQSLSPQHPTQLTQLNNPLINNWMPNMKK